MLSFFRRAAVAAARLWEWDIAQMFLLPSALVSLMDAAERGFLVLLLIIDEMRTFEGDEREEHFWVT